MQFIVVAFHGEQILNKFLKVVVISIETASTLCCDKTMATKELYLVLLYSSAESW